MFGRIRILAFATAALVAPEAWAAQDYVGNVDADASQPQDARTVSLTAGQDYIINANGTAGHVVCRFKRPVVRATGGTGSGSGRTAAGSARHR